jgi:uncharacterized protein
VVLPPKNLLGEQTSPYLLQHKDNPVHWRSWSHEALEEARRENKPILLSSGYAACHWCHVMAHECFEDEEVADVMNRLFVNIKLDREERPDIDQIYMAALAAMGEQGGWPLTMFLTPDAKPFWGGTYFPKKARFGRPGFIDVLLAVHSAWENKKEDLLRSADNLAAHVQKQLAPAQAGGAAAEPLLEEMVGKVAGLMDPQLGGFRGAPKFPNAPFLELLWLSWLEHRVPQHRDAVLRTLRYMLSGGIYDHVGGGLARYATDAEWLVPHFEKMLYDNAQLLRLASFTYGETGNDLFRMRIEETADWLLREMRVKGGGFASSLDADSEGEEGKFYLWTEEELRQVLGSDTERLLDTFHLARPSGWEGDPILHRLENPCTEPERERKLRELLDRLRLAREARPRPGRDDKVLVDWNGMTITALATAGRLLNRPEWIEAAEKAFRYVCESMRDGRLPHSIRGERRLFPALASDYAAMISAAVALHAARRDETLLRQALDWSQLLDDWYSDEIGDGYYLTASDNTDVPMRIRGDVDDPVPSATAQIITALTGLAGAAGSHELYEKAAAVAEAALGRARGQFHGQAGIITAAAIAGRPMKLLIHEPTTERLIPVANRFPDPRRVDIPVGQEESQAEQLAGISIDRTVPGAWLCVGQSCLPPIGEPAELEMALRNQRQLGGNRGWAI